MHSLSPLLNRSPPRLLQAAASAQRALAFEAPPGPYQALRSGLSVMTPVMRFLSPLLNGFPPGLLPCAASPWHLRFQPCSPGPKFFSPSSRMLICISCIALVHTPTQRLAFRAMECDGDTLDAIHTTLARSYLDLEVMLDEFYTVLLRIKLFCHIIAVCLVVTLLEGIRALSYPSANRAVGPRQRASSRPPWCPDPPSSPTAGGR